MGRRPGRAAPAGRRRVSGRLARAARRRRLDVRRGGEPDGQRAQLAGRASQAGQVHLQAEGLRAGQHRDGGRRADPRRGPLQFDDKGGVVPVLPSHHFGLLLTIAPKRNSTPTY